MTLSFRVNHNYSWWCYGHYLNHIDDHSWQYLSINNLPDADVHHWIFFDFTNLNTLGHNKWPNTSIWLQLPMIPSSGFVKSVFSWPLVTQLSSIQWNNSPVCPARGGGRQLQHFTGNQKRKMRFGCNCPRVSQNTELQLWILCSLFREIWKLSLLI